MWRIRPTYNIYAPITSRSQTKTKNNNKTTTTTKNNTHTHTRTHARTHTHRQKICKHKRQISDYIFLFVVVVFFFFFTSSVPSVKLTPSRGQAIAVTQKCSPRQTYRPVSVSVLHADTRARTPAGGCRPASPAWLLASRYLHTYSTVKVIIYQGEKQLQQVANKYESNWPIKCALWSIIIIIMTIIIIIIMDSSDTAQVFLRHKNHIALAQLRSRQYFIRHELLSRVIYCWEL